MRLCHLLKFIQTTYTLNVIVASQTSPALGFQIFALAKWLRSYAGTTDALKEHWWTRWWTRSSGAGNSLAWRQANLEIFPIIVLIYSHRHGKSISILIFAVLLSLNAYLSNFE